MYAMIGLGPGGVYFPTDGSITYPPIDPDQSDQLGLLQHPLCMCQVSKNGRNSLAPGRYSLATGSNPSPPHFRIESIHETSPAYL